MESIQCCAKPQSRYFLCSLHACVLWLALVFPVTEVFAGRPFDGTDPSVVDRSMIEVKFGPLDFRRDPNQLNWHIPMIGFNLGIASGWEFIVEGEWERARASGNHADGKAAAIGLKHVMREGSLQGNSGFSVATELTLERLPGGNADTGVELAAIIGNQWDWGALYFNLAAARTPERDEELFLSAIWEGTEVGGWHPVAEFSFVQNFHNEEEIAGLLGFIYESGHDIAFDFAIRRSHGDASSESQLRLGLTVEFSGF